MINKERIGIAALALIVVLIGASASGIFSGISIGDSGTNCEWIELTTDSGETVSDFNELESLMGTQEFEKAMKSAENSDTLDIRENQGIVEYRSCLSYE